jgi:hypothetical protein
MRATQWRNQDGTVVRYLQLAHNHRVTGVTRAEVLVNLGREDRLVADGLRDRRSPSETTSNARGHQNISRRGRPGHRP